MSDLGVPVSSDIPRLEFGAEILTESRDSNTHFLLFRILDNVGDILGSVWHTCQSWGVLYGSAMVQKLEILVSLTLGKQS